MLCFCCEKYQRKIYQLFSSQLYILNNMSIFIKHGGKQSWPIYSLQFAWKKNWNLLAQFWETSRLYQYIEHFMNYKRRPPTHQSITLPPIRETTIFVIYCNDIYMPICVKNKQDPAKHNLCIYFLVCALDITMSFIYTGPMTIFNMSHIPFHRFRKKKSGIIVI